MTAARPIDPGALDIILDRLERDYVHELNKHWLPWRSPRLRRLSVTIDVLYDLWHELHAAELAELLSRS